MKERQIPAIIYSTLKLYGKIRFKTLVNHFFSLVLCLLYYCVLKIMKKLSDTQIKDYMNTNVFAPSSLMKFFYCISQI